MQQGMLSRMGTALTTPAQGWTWTQLAAATIFVLAVALAWRQVTQFIVREV